ncbi:MAG: helix-turn-helix transcriptional regulator [Oscillospiraceae bacterium]|nr:helix-turn-helix transcriptional regulator [Oscillospiraceae bacterium]
MKTDKEYGYVTLTLDTYLKKRNISRYQLLKEADLQPTQLMKYLRGEIQRPDFAVLARICYVLGCQISDILVYTPPRSAAETALPQKETSC